MIKQPDCRVIVFNLDEREGSNLLGSPLGIPLTHEELDISSNVISINTTKQKSSASGTFTMQIDPSQNWVSKISVGSWIAIFMDEKPISELSLLKWEEDSLKWIGRIDSVRASRQVDQTSGAWITTYTIVGRDWASSLEAMIYVDTMAGESPATLGLAPGNSGFGQVARLLFDDKVRELYDKGAVSSSNIADALLNLWGEQGNAFNITSTLAENNLAERFMPFAPFYLPPRIPSSMGKPPLPQLSALVDRKYGILKGEGEYENNTEAAGAFDFRTILGVNSIWQVLNNTTSVGGINELLADLDFSSGSPSMSIFKRVRPFALKPAGGLLSSVGSLLTSSVVKSNHAADITSSFFLLPKTYIDPNNITYIDVGGNWSDVVNFIEVMPNTSLFPLLSNALALFKGDNAIYSVKSYTVSGFKPIRFDVHLLPIKGDGTLDINGIKDWLEMLREWYFDTHKMLNGTISFSGQSGYITVGSNVIFPASAIANSTFIAESSIPSLGSGDDQHILAHVETVSHSISKSPNGAVNYTTTVQFVRGIIVDQDGSGRVADGNDGFGVDSEAPSGLKNNNNTVVTK